MHHSIDYDCQDRCGVYHSHPTRFVVPGVRLHSEDSGGQTKGIVVNDELKASQLDRVLNGHLSLLGPDAESHVLWSDNGGKVDQRMLSRSNIVEARCWKAV